MQRAVFTLIGAIAMASTLPAQIVQGPGEDFLAWQAEDFQIDDRNDEITGFAVLDVENPEEFELHNSNPGFIQLPPPDMNAYGGKALFDQVNGGDFADQVGYQLVFDQPGIYYLYMRYSMYDLRNFADPGYGNEDSVYLPATSIDEDPASDAPEVRNDRIGFAAFSSNVDGVDVSPLDGCRIDEDPYFDCEELPPNDPRFEGQYHWQTMVWTGQDGEQVNYVIEDAGEVLDFAIATRERGTSIDAIVLSEDPGLLPEDLDAFFAETSLDGDYNENGELDAGDLDVLGQYIRDQNLAGDIDGNGTVDGTDATLWTDTLQGSYLGDSNFDGEFSSRDFVDVFTAGKYETGEAATYAEGDWDLNQLFESADFVAAFVAGGYELGPRAATAAVPEPSSGLLALLGLGCLVRRRRNR